MTSKDIIIVGFDIEKIFKSLPFSCLNDPKKTKKAASDVCVYAPLSLAGDAHLTQSMGNMVGGCYPHRGVSLGIIIIKCKFVT